MEKITLSVEETQAIINYLGTKPYGEVYQIVALLVSRLPKQEEKQDEPKTKT